MSVIQKTIIEEKLRAFCNDNNISNIDKGFMYYVYSLYEDISYENIDENDIVDGSEDKQIDLIRIEDNEEELIINLYQVKKESGFSSNTLIHMKNGLKWIFELPYEQLNDNKNKKFISKIKEIRSHFAKYGMGSMIVKLNYVCMGNKSDIGIGSEFDQEYKSLYDEYSVKGFKNFEFNLIGVEEISQYIDLVNHRNKRINVDIPIVVNANIPSVIERYDKDIKSIICTANAEDIAKLVLKDKGDILFDKNIRKYLDKRGKVNKEIYKTCTSNDESDLFWYLNNGLTIICDKLDKSFIGSEYTLKLENAQIINGCQTSTTLYQAFIKEELHSDTKLILRVYETRDPDLTKKITIATNNQNPISIKDLRSNDDIQKKIQEYIKMTYCYEVEIKRNEFKNKSDIDKSRIITNEKMGQAFLAVILGKPHTALSSKASIFNSNYDRIFNNKSHEGLMLSYLILHHANLKKKQEITEYDQLKVDIIMYAHFHIAYAIGKILLNKNKIKIKDLDKIKDLNLGIINGRIDIESLYDDVVDKIYLNINQSEDSYKNIMSFLRKSESLNIMDKVCDDIISC